MKIRRCGMDVDEDDTIMYAGVAAGLVLAVFHRTTPSPAYPWTSPWSRARASGGRSALLHATLLRASSPDNTRSLPFPFAAAAAEDDYIDNGNDNRGNGNVGSNKVKCITAHCGGDCGYPNDCWGHHRGRF
jgi:hypothetical protein